MHKTYSILLFRALAKNVFIQLNYTIRFVFKCLACLISGGKTQCLLVLLSFLMAK